MLLNAKKKQGNCHKYTSYADPISFVQRMLRELYSVGRAVQRRTAEKYDERCA